MKNLQRILNIIAQSNATKIRAIFLDNFNSRSITQWFNEMGHLKKDRKEKNISLNTQPTHNNRNGSKT